MVHGPPPIRALYGTRGTCPRISASYSSAARPRIFLRGSRENHDSLTKTRQQNLHSKMNEEIEREQEEAKMEVFFFFQMRCLGRGLRVIKLHAVTVELVED